MARILWADDNEPLRRSLARHLHHAGHEVVEVGTGVDAIFVLEHQSIDVVVCDILMPGRDGLEVLRWLQHRPEPIPFIAISGGGRGEAGSYLDIARKFGADETLEKPFHPATLLEAIARVLGT